MFDGIIKLANLARQVKEHMIDLEALTNLLNNRIEYLNNENDELRKDNQRLRQFLSGQDE
jgi:regulator of replication initiation timing